MNEFNLSFPIEMIKKEERIVIGIATADNVDKSNDIVDFEASKEAFANWSGNIREMHAPIAVGKAVNYEPVEIEDAEGKKYNAIKVSAYISKGAENTWQKILDGTLRAFSIGGKIIQKEALAEKMQNGRPINIIKKYTLGELSLVDNPANALATIDVVKMNKNGALEYVLSDIGDQIVNETVERAKAKLKDPKGGLTAAGRRHFKETEGANLKPGVKGPADTPEKMRRKGSFLTRFFTNPSGPMKDEKGRPTRLALSAAAWGEPVPQDRSDAAALAAKGRRLLERYAKIKEKSIEDILEEDSEILSKEMEFFMSEEYLIDEEEIVKMQENLLQNDIKYDKVLNMNEPDEKLSLLKRLVNWMVPDVQEEASTEIKVEVTENTQEEDMDIEVLKDALGTVVDEKLTAFATSIKEEVEASVQEKIDTITKSLEVQNTELQEKLEATEKALAEQEEKVQAFATAGAVKKSVDPEDDEDGEELAKSHPSSVWDNVYLPKGLIKALGYDS